MNTCGKIIAVCTGSGGIPKAAVDNAQVTHLGLDGDLHTIPEHGGENRAVCLFAWEDYQRLIKAGVPANTPGSYGENLLTQGLDYSALRPGDRLRLGESVELEIWDVREPCVTLQQLDPRFPDLLTGRSGFLCRVLEPGTVAPGQSISLAPAGAGRAAPTTRG